MIRSRSRSPRTSRSISFTVGVIVTAGTAMLVGFTAGCGSRLHQLDGTVFVDGRPAGEGARVVFTPLGNSKPAHGTIDGQGRFVLTTQQQRGVMPGEYRVLLFNSTASIPQPTNAPEPGINVPPPEWIAYQQKLDRFLENPPKGPGWIPKRYAALDGSPLMFRVPNDGPHATFEVQSETPANKTAKGSPAASAGRDVER